MIIDFHCHYNSRFFRYREYRLSAEELIAAMDQHGVTRAIVTPAGEYQALRHAEGNAEVFRLARSRPERILGFAAINPWTCVAGQEELRRAKEDYGFAGLTLHPMLQGFEANDPLVYPLVETALELKMIIYVTAGAPLLAMPYKVADLARRYPEGRFVLGHAGWDFHFDVPDCLEQCPNLWAETSKNGLANLEALSQRFAERLLFGSDFPFSNYVTELEKIRLLPQLNEAQRAAILGGNAQALLDGVAR